MTDPTPKPSAVTQAGRSDYMSGYYSGLLQADSLARNYLYSRGWLINFILDAQGTRAGISRLIREFAGLTWIDDNGPVPEGEAPWEIEATQASHTAEVERLRADGVALRGAIAAIREAADDEDDAAFTQAMHDAYATMTMSALALNGMTLTATGDRHDEA